MVAWIGRFGAVELGHVHRRWEIGRSVAYSLVRRLVEAGLLERVQTLPGDPTLIRATLNGLRYVRLRLPLAKVSAYQVDHWAACASVALRAEERWGRDSVVSRADCERWRQSPSGRSEAASSQNTGAATRHSTARPPRHFDRRLTESRLRSSSPRRHRGGWS